MASHHFFSLLIEESKSYTGIDKINQLIISTVEEKTGSKIRS